MKVSKRVYPDYEIEEIEIAFDNTDSLKPEDFLKSMNVGSSSYGLCFRRNDYFEISDKREFSRKYDDVVFYQKQQSMIVEYPMMDKSLNISNPLKMLERFYGLEGTLLDTLLNTDGEWIEFG